MQFAKDSFAVALRERLAALNPGRTVTLGGVQRPAVVVRENEMPNAAEPAMECFYLEWGACRAVGEGGGLGGPRARAGGTGPGAADDLPAIVHGEEGLQPGARRGAGDGSVL